MWYLNIALTIVMALGVGVIVYALAVGVVDLIAKVRADRADRWMDDYREWFNSFNDNVYYRDSYAELFSKLVWRVERETTEIDASSAESVRNLLTAVNQFIDDSKDEREYYCDVFENIIENLDEFNNYVDVDGVKVIRGVLSSYVDGVRSSKVVK